LDKYKGKVTHSKRDKKRVIFFEGGGRQMHVINSSGCRKLLGKDLEGWEGKYRGNKGQSITGHEVIDGEEA
jgi:hypothetical protein